MGPGDHLDLTDDLTVQLLGDLAVDLLALEEDVAARGRLMRQMARPMVVLPEPDSPTSEKVSPL